MDLYKRGNVTVQSQAEPLSGVMKYDPAAGSAFFADSEYRYLFGDNYEETMRNQMQEIQQTEEEETSWGCDKEYMRCRAGRSSFRVSWDGIMTACGMLPFPVEKHPFEQPFRDCWMELTEKVRTTPVLTECKGCEKKKICNPCVAMLYAETGNVNCRAQYLCEMSDYIIGGIKTELKEGITDERE